MAPDAPPPSRRSSPCGSPRLARADALAERRIREAMGALFAGQTHVLPVLVMILFQHVATAREEPRNAQEAMLGVVRRGAEALHILSEVAQEAEEKQLEQARHERARAPLRDEVNAVLVKATLFALGGALGHEDARGVVLWCVATFAIYEVLDVFGELLTWWAPRAALLQQLQNLKWVVCLCLLSNAEPAAPLRERAFSQFAIGYLLHHTLFLREPQRAKLLHAAACAVDLACSNKASMVLLAVRLLYV